MDRSVVAFAGDWHGSGDWARRTIAAASAAGANILLHAGDFGIWRGLPGERYLEIVNEACLEHGVTIYVTPGNHENWSLILDSELDERDSIGAVAWFGERVAVLPRGHRFTLGGRSVVSVGGAPSIDRKARVNGVDWFPEEMITAAQVAEIVTGGPADVMIAHDAPESPWQSDLVAAVCVGNSGELPPKVRNYARVGRLRMSEVFAAVLPQLYVHGHYHLADENRLTLPGEGRYCRMISLDRERTNGNLVIVDLETLTPIRR